MRRLLGLSLMTAILLAVAASVADACYCGAGRCRCCMSACQARSSVQSVGRAAAPYEDLQGGRVRETAVDLLQDLLRAGV